MLAAAIFVLLRGWVWIVAFWSSPSERVDVEEDFSNKMTLVGSNIGSSSGEGGNGGPPTCAWVSLTLEEHLTNFERIFQRLREDCEVSFSGSVAKVMKEMRNDPFANIESLLLDEGLYDIFHKTTPLHWAVLMDDRTMVQHILTSGKVDINAKMILNRIPLHFAVVGGNHDIVEDLLEHKADVRICDYNHRSVLCYMFEEDAMFDILKKILANNVNMHDEARNTTLHYAAMKGAANVVTYLLDQKANVNLHNSYGWTPLHYAVHNRNPDIVTCLLQQGADVNATDKYGYNPLFLSLSSYRVWSDKIIALGANVLAKDKKKNNAVRLAIQRPSITKDMMKIVKVLREHDVDANAKNSKGYSPFFAAVVEGYTEVVEELLQSKDKINLMEECNGQTPIQIAFDYGHEHIKRVLLDCDDVSRYVDGLYRDRQVYVDAANAILVGAALIASVTFASWLQPPLGYTTPYLDLAPSSSNVDYVDVQHNISLRAFWIFNTLSFYFAIGTVVFGARSVLPRRQMFIKTIVVKLHQNLLVTSILLACSVFSVIVAFGIAGCIVLTPTLKFQWYMIVPTIFGGLVCLISLGFLFKSMVEDNLEKKGQITNIHDLYYLNRHLLDLRRLGM